VVDVSDFLARVLETCLTSQPPTSFLHSWRVLEKNCTLRRSSRAWYNPHWPSVANAARPLPAGQFQQLSQFDIWDAVRCSDSAGSTPERAKA